MHLFHTWGSPLWEYTVSPYCFFHLLNSLPSFCSIEAFIFKLVITLRCFHANSYLIFRDQTVYLAIRNLIISLWCFNPCRILTVKRCCQHLLLRGLTRVRLCTIDVPQILTFAVRKGLVNLGAIKRPLPKPTKDASTYLSHIGTLPPEYSCQKV